MSDRDTVVIQIRLDRGALRKGLTIGVLAALVAVPSYLLAGQVDPPAPAFTSGTVISAAAVNGALDALEAAVNDNDNRIGALQAGDGNGPQLSNSVAAAAGGVRVETCSINNNDAGTVSKDNSSGLCDWISSVSRYSIGIVNVQFAAGTFAVVPVCTVTVNNHTRMVRQLAYRTYISIFAYDPNGAPADTGFSLICVGKR
ncbi:MAG: hypothetical protein CVU56_17915 [Deltaproteobacteria bacterium HGW-Deltaproteobacteria-14]|nr:MAG: hypothetical protein CVU56_17915 [Deltaproteobacteria bacterium HGW-Deltaproteobacteria-14]